MQLHEIVGALKDELSEHYKTVRISAVQNQEQFTRELNAMNPDRLPGVIIVFDNFLPMSMDAVQEHHLTLVLVDKFTAASDEKALSLFRAAGKLLELFPLEGRMIADQVFIHPEDCVSASPDSQFAALALGIVCKQGF